MINNKKTIRKKRTRGKISGTKERPRLSVFRSSKNIYAQIINDENHKTIASAKSSEIKNSEKKEVDLKSKKLIAYQVGELIASKALKLKIDKVVFDRGGCMYHGRVKSLAEGARKGGLKF